ncbi:MAG TPA: DNA translocase FtsK 4TM domain-containing protein [Alphaproteobacteria bacterium]|nr:DNA translocase FtsK 4TM domain-containing protein [Alphaproteobacteria bacterium]
MKELAGCVLIGIAALLVVALATYFPDDPSPHVTRAANADPRVRNLLGLPGAYAAAFMITSLGISSFAAALVMGVWGWRMVSHRSIPRWWLRLVTLLTGLLLLAAAFGTLPAPAAWPKSAALGGATGYLLNVKIVNGLAPAGFEAYAPFVVGLLAVAVLAVAAAVTPGEWRSAGSFAARLGGMAGRNAGAAAGRLGRQMRDRYRDMPAVTLPRRRVDELYEDEPAEDPVAAEIAAEPLSRGRRRVRVEPRLGAPEPEAAGHEDEEDDLPPPAPEPRRTAKPVVERTAAMVEPALRKAPPPPAPAAAKPALELTQASDYELPPLDLLQLPDPRKRHVQHDEATLQANAEALEGVLGDFGVRGQIQKVHPGPVVTLYELEPAPGTKSSRVIGLADDIARSMSAVSVRVAVVPGRNVLGVELPNHKRETVWLRELMASEAFEHTSMKLALALGKDIGGVPQVVDLAKMPHLLVAGTTGSGKSVAVNTMILSLLYRLPPDKCRFIMVDPKMLELSIYDGIPHLLAPVVTDPKKAVVALKWTVREMEDRYRAMSKLGVRNIDGYNARLREARERGESLTRRVQTGFDPDTGKPIFEDQPLDLTELPYIVVIVDELADLMLVAGKDIEAAIQRLAQMARAAGIHLIMATQRPSVDVITGTIKANFPVRISFQVTSKIDSRTILGEQGAEQLLGQGDMLYMAGGGRISRCHGAFVADGEVESVVAFLKAQGEPDYIDAVTEDQEEFGDGGGGETGNMQSGDEVYDQAVALVLRERKCSTSFIQRHLQIGYNRAARLVERMEQEGVVSQANHVGKREVLGRKPDEEY